MKSKEQKYLKAKEWAQNNPEKRRYTRWKSDIKKKYNLTPKDYFTLMDMQEGVCAICLSVQKTKKGNTDTPWNLAVDHCHRTGKVRGLLCNECNRAIGILGDTYMSVKRAADYLEGFENEQ